MHFVILGSGAVGGYFGAKLAQSGEKVSFIARGEHLSAMQKHGLKIESIKGNFSVDPVIAAGSGEPITDIDVVIVAVKSYQLAEAIDSILPMISAKTRIIPLLNGVNAIEQLTDLGVNEAQIIGGIAKIISAIKSPGMISHLGTEPHLTFGFHLSSENHSISPDEFNNLETIVTKFKQADVSIAISRDIQIALWRKFIFVAAWGALASIDNKTVGQLRTGAMRANLEQIVTEYANIAQAIKVNITHQMVQETLKFIDLLPEHSTTSMQRDIAQIISGEKTECEFDVLVAYPYSLAKKHHVACPQLSYCYENVARRLAK